jgi:hypothetical protein
LGAEQLSAKSRERLTLTGFSDYAWKEYHDSSRLAEEKEENVWQSRPEEGQSSLDTQIIGLPHGPKRLLETVRKNNTWF